MGYCIGFSVDFTPLSRFSQTNFLSVLQKMSSMFLLIVGTFALAGLYCSSAVNALTFI